MSDALQLILEDTDGTQLETSCTRFAVVWQGKEVWIQQAGNGQRDFSSIMESLGERPE